MGKNKTKDEEHLHILFDPKRPCDCWRCEERVYRERMEKNSPGFINQMIKAVNKYGQELS